MTSQISGRAATLPTPDNETSEVQATRNSVSPTPSNSRVGVCRTVRQPVASAVGFLNRNHGGGAMKISVNGQDRILDEADPTMPLLWAIRDLLGLKGTKFGCGQALCGACTVHMDGQPIRSCQTSLADVGGSKVTTIEAVTGRVADAVKLAWIKNNVPQCGYCQSGQIMSAVALLETNSKPSRDDVNSAMSGNICRCGTYPRIRAAIADASQALAQR